MKKNKWIALAITLVVVIASLGLVKLLPFWVTLFSLVTFIAGFIAGYIFKDPKTITVEKVIEVPAKPKRISKAKKENKKVE